MGSVVAVLALSANTSFADFPRLCRVLALDRFLPDTFAVARPPPRLLARHRRARPPLRRCCSSPSAASPIASSPSSPSAPSSRSRSRRRAWCSTGAGSAGRAAPLAVDQRRRRGGHGHHAGRRRRLQVRRGRVARRRRRPARRAARSRGSTGTTASWPAGRRRSAARRSTETQPPIVVVPVQSWSKLTSRGLRFALELSHDVRALHILTQDSTISRAHRRSGRSSSAGPRAPAGSPLPQLVLRKSTYRQFFAPLIDYVEQLRDGHPDRDIVVIVPDLVVRRWYQRFLHNNRGAWLRGAPAPARRPARRGRQHAVLPGGLRRARRARARAGPARPRVRCGLRLRR